MSHTVHAVKGLHKQTDIKHKEAGHHDRVAVAAYFHAEHRGFQGGDPVADWLAAEADLYAASNKVGDAGVH